MFSWREVRFIICTIAVLTVYKIIGAGWLMNVVAGNAMVNLFTGQYLCTTNGCTIDKPGFTVPFLSGITIPNDPIAIVHYITTAIGLLFLFYGSVHIFT
ncbi:MAG: hypothetical protein HQL70_05280 [Magnetococcales bacterium]|nr:hypothetical protein [Magnetococcales bacterium]